MKKISRAKFRKVRLAIRHRKLSRAHAAAVADARLHDVILDTIAVDELGFGPAETAVLLAAQEDSDAD